MMKVNVAPPAVMDASTKMDSSTNTATTAASEDPLDCWNLDLDDILDESSNQNESLPPLMRSLSVDPAPSTGPKPRGILRRTKSHDGTTNPAPRRKLREVRETRSKSPALRRTFSRGNSRSPPKRTVSFDKVRVREFQQILGDNPCKEGPSLGLGWNYHEKKETQVDKFESKRTSYFSMSPRQRDYGCLTPQARQEKAIKLGYTLEEIQKNAKQNARVQKQRQKTVEGAMRLQEAASWESTDPLAMLNKARQAHGFK